MTTLYKAVQPVGRFAKGDIIGDMPDAQINQLLADGVIKAYQPAETKTEDKPVNKAETKQTKAEGVNNG